MTRRSRRFLLAAVFLLGIPVSQAQAQDLKLGFVDIERAVSETEDGRRGKADLQKVFQTKQKELEERQNQLRKQFEELEKKRTLLPQDKLREQEATLQKQALDLQQTLGRHQEELDRRRNEVMGKIIDRMQRIIAKISASENFSMVFDRQQAGLVFAKPHLDMTNELIRRYNAGEGAEGGAAKKPAAAPPAKK